MSNAIRWQNVTTNSSGATVHFSIADNTLDTTAGDTNYYFPTYPDYYIPNYYYPWYPTIHYISCPKCAKLVECTDSYCKHCGHQLKPKTCPNCGKPLE